ncbi:MAG: hypothetical protein AABZ74_15290 [Cyanobacteriota bacterium]
MKKNLLFFFVSVLSFSCSFENKTINQKLNSDNVNVTKLLETNILNVSDKNGAKLEVKFDFSKSFKTKASINGIPAKTINDIKSVKLYLTKSNGTNPLSALNLVFTSAVLSYTSGSTSQSYTFNNVPSGTYYVASELFEDTLATKNIIEPVNYDSLVVGDTANGFTNSKRGLSLSTNSCTITPVSLLVSFSDTSSNFKIAPALLNAIGANLDTTIAPTNGSNVSGNVSVQ